MEWTPSPTGRGDTRGYGKPIPDAVTVEDTKKILGHMLLFVSNEVYTIFRYLSVDYHLLESRARLTCKLSTIN